MSKKALEVYMNTTDEALCEMDSTKTALLKEKAKKAEKAAKTTEKPQVQKQAEQIKEQAKKAEREAIEKRLLSKYEMALYKVAHLKAEIERLSEQIELEKAKATIAVCSAKDDTGKPLYTNDKQREAAVVMALAESKDYQLLLANYARNLTDLRLAEADVKVADKAIAFYLKAEVD